MTLEEGLELIENYKKGLKKFLDTLPEQSVQLGSEMIKTLTISSKNEIANLEEVLDTADLPENIPLKADKGYQSEKNEKRNLKNHILKKPKRTNL